MNDPAPEARRLEDVGLVDGRELAPAGLSELEPPPRDPLDLARVVLARVERRAVLPDAARAEVETADELADDQEIDVALT